MKRHYNTGFTLIEVLLALAVIAIALAALLKSMAQSVDHTHRMKQKAVSHWVAMQGVAMVQLGLLNIIPNQETTQDTIMLGTHWYWRVKTQTTPLKNLQLITILVSTEKSGPYREEIQAFRYAR